MLNIIAGLMTMQIKDAWIVVQRPLKALIIVAEILQISLCKIDKTLQHKYNRTQSCSFLTHSEYRTIYDGGHVQL